MSRTWAPPWGRGVRPVDAAAGAVASWRRAAGRRDAHGFTLVELLAVIAIIGLLVGLLLPAVQSARESSRRTSCATKLRQIAGAVLAYEAANGTFPPAVMASGICKFGLNNSGSWDSTVYSAPASTATWCISNMSGMVYLLPHLEQTSLYDKADLNSYFGRTREPFHNSAGSIGMPPRTWCSGSGNIEIVMARLAVNECPTASVENSPGAMPPGYTDRTRFVSYWNSPGRTANYTFVTSGIGNCDGWRNARPTERPNRSLFGEESFARAGMVVDGLSSVLMLGETTSVRPQASNADSSQTGQPWASMDQAAFGVTSLGVANNTINKWGSPPKPGKLFSNSAPGSEHPGGCHFTMADGAVRFVSELTSQTVMGQLARIADGQVPLDGL